jgi:uncharacterized integral membrane protein
MTSPSSQERDRSESESIFTWRFWVIVAIVIYGIIFVVLNSKSVKISFVFFSATTSVLVALLLAGALGFVAGLLTWRRREQRTKRN